MELTNVTWYRRVRAQLAFTYLLGGGVAAVLALAFAYVAFNMLLTRMAINTVERQVALIVEMTGQRAELFLRFVPVGPRPPGTASPPPPGAPPPPGSPPPGTSRSGVQSRTQCRDEKGTMTTRTFPGNAVFELPEWLTAERFAGVVYDKGVPWIRAYARSQHGACRVEVLAESPVNRQLAETIGEASAMELTIPSAPVLTPVKSGEATKSGRPSLPAIAWSNVVGRFPRGLPAVVTAYSWETGNPMSRALFLVRPDVATTWAQLTRFGQQQRRWLTAMGLIAALFLFVELLAAWLALRLARRIVRSVNVLSEAAGQYGSGNLSYRIRGLRDDQLGRLGSSFHRMAESIHESIVKIKQNERLEEEIRVARQVQESLLPSRLPLIEGARLAAVCFPARNVSGDIYDVLDLGEGVVGLLCADVSGKGVPAALMMSNVQAMVRTMIEGCDGARPSPANLLERLNREVYRYSPSNTFVTLFWAEYDGKRRLLRWANAGHCPALLMTAGEEVWLRDGGFPVGMFPSAVYRDQERLLPAGSTLVTYTDGVVEAERDDGESFGEEGLVAVCRLHAGAGPDGMIHAVVDSVRSFVHGQELGDDLTMVVLQS